MYGIFWILMAGIARWLTGDLIGEEGYGEILEGYTGGLDVIFGVVGAYIACYFFLPRSSPPYLNLSENADTSNGTLREGLSKESVSAREMSALRTAWGIGDRALPLDIAMKTEH